MTCSRNTRTSSAKRGPRSRRRVGCPPSERLDGAQGAERPGLPPTLPAMVCALCLRHLMRFSECHHSPRRTFRMTSWIDPTAQHLM